MIGFSEHTAELLRSGNKQFIVTGATGWLGRATLEMLASALGNEFRERVSAYGSRHQNLQLSQGEQLKIEPLTNLVPQTDTAETYVFHYAFLTKDKVAGMSEQEYFQKNRAISRQVRAGLAGRNIRGLLVASSGAVYDYRVGSGRDASASPYGQLKAEDEEQFAAMCAGAGISLVMPRIFNLSGPFINKYEDYVLASIIVDILRGGPIRLKARQSVLRSYVYIGDVVELCQHWLLNSERGEQFVFDTAGAEIVEVEELAQRSRAVLQAEDMAIERLELTSPSENRYVGDGARMTSMANQYDYEMLGLDEQIRLTAAYIRGHLQH
jgi:UDP-glucuronate decarboxylase